MLVLIPRFFNPKRYTVFVFSVICSFVLISLLPQTLIALPTAEPPSHELQLSSPKHLHANNRSFWTTIFRSFLPFSFSFLCSFFWFKSIEQQTLERAKAKAELLNLKYQLQPHFLFNTLNSLYSLALTKSDDAPEAILKLSNVMRYVVQESSKDTVELKKELQYLKDYIALQLIRTDHSLDYSYTEIGHAENAKIAPLILVNFIENAFKYGFNPEETSKIDLKIIINENRLDLEVFNYIVNHAVNETDRSRIGLKNTIERLRQIYPQSHQIHIHETPSEYHLKLTLHL
ncbi:sensor histidine kinase [Bergeyella sp. RCAD1439]|uniref:sensor histidine kinase n=1 Tax=Bergeyella anatis TaxID=3113737 RepID=UPI002E1992BC|nr:histidine kinase [Bergeyella sp. RCAD1439]